MIPHQYLRILLDKVNYLSLDQGIRLVFDKYNYNTMEQELMIWLSSILIGDCGGDDISWVSPTTSHQGCSVGGTQVILPNGYSELIDLLIEKYFPANRTSVV